MRKLLSIFRRKVKFDFKNTVIYEIGKYPEVILTDEFDYRRN